MKWDEMTAAFDEAERTMRFMDNMATVMAKMLAGRLRHVNSSYALERLKRELKDYNIQTGYWKESV